MRPTSVQDVGTAALSCPPVPLRHMVMPLVVVIGGRQLRLAETTFATATAIQRARAAKLSSNILTASSTSVLVMFRGGERRITLP